MNSKIITKIVLILSFSYCSTIAGTLKGNVKYDGKPPKKKRLRMDADPVCGSSHSKPVLSENFKMGEDGSMEEALVYLKNVPYSGVYHQNQQCLISRDASTLLMFLG